MIFTALGLLVLGIALLIAGVAKTSVLLLMLSLVSAVAGMIVIAVAYSVARAARGADALAAVPVAPGAVGAGVPGQIPTQGGVFMYVPVEQLPAMAPAAAAMKVGAASNGNGSAGGGAPIAGYDDMTAEQVGKLIASGALNDAQLQALRDYEAAHGARKTVLDRIDRSLFNA